MNGAALAQAAMEYLITYGWAILVIAVALAALFELGVFDVQNFEPQACIGQTGFVCQNPIYTSNGLSVTLGQINQQDYYGDWVFITSEGALLGPNGVPVNFTKINAVQAGFGSASVLAPGQTITVTIPPSKFGPALIPDPTVGTHFAGYVWLGYCLNPCTSPVYYSKVAALTVKSS